MKSIKIQGGHLITPNEERFADIVIEGEFIKVIGQTGAPTANSPLETQIIDANDCFVSPGLFDLQVNGAEDCDLWDNPNHSGFNKLGNSLVKAGVTSFLPTLITGDLKQIKANAAFLAKEIDSSQTNGNADNKAQLAAQAVGIHLEGPFLSPEKPGVHPSQFLQPLKKTVLQTLLNEKVSLITLAPELDPSYECVDQLVKKGIVVSLGHSNATFEEAQQAFDHGVTLVTHTFNAMPSIHHRNPGAVTAALLNKNVYCAIICDGKHLSAPIAEMIIRLKGTEKTILVTDISKIGTSKGDLVGSSIFLNEAVKNVVKWNIATFNEAITMASYNPATVMGVENSIGQLKEGRKADIVVWDKKSLDIKHVILAGKIVY